MIPPSYFAMLAEASYSSTPTWCRSDVQACLTIRDGLRIVTFRGTDDVIALWRDLLAIGPDTFDHPELGPLHEGFYSDVIQVFEQIEADVGDGPVAISGHSKGGSEAQIYAALRILRKRPVDSVWTFGAARVGALKGLLLSIPGTDYRHGLDPIPELPSWLDHPRAVTHLAEGRAPPMLDILRIADHRIAAYRAALSV